MTPELAQNHYQVLPGFVRLERTQRLAQRFIEFSQGQALTSDGQVPGAFSMYNFMPFLELLVEKTPIVAKLLQEPMLPTYSYARIYKRGNVLERHKDRPACEISLTLNLKADAGWPIYFEVPGKAPVSLGLNPGDAALYLGCETEHWREAYQGDEYIQVFLHYVRSRGPCASAYFDNKQWQTRRQEETAKGFNT